MTFLTLYALASQTAFTQDLRDWRQATARLHPGDALRLSLKTGPVDCRFTGSTAEDLTADAGTIKKEDILKIERRSAKRYGRRSTHTINGAGIGAAAGGLIFALHPDSFFGGGISAAFGAVLGAMVGAVIGALLPAGAAKWEPIYSAK